MCAPLRRDRGSDAHRLRVDERGDETAALRGCTPRPPAPTRPHRHGPTRPAAWRTRPDGPTPSTRPGTPTHRVGHHAHARGLRLRRPGTPIPPRLRAAVSKRRARLRAKGHGSGHAATSAPGGTTGRTRACPGEASRPHRTEAAPQPVRRIGPAVRALAPPLRAERPVPSRVVHSPHRPCRPSWLSERLRTASRQPRIAHATPLRWQTDRAADPRGARGRRQVPGAAATLAPRRSQRDRFPHRGDPRRRWRAQRGPGIPGVAGQTPPGPSRRPAVDAPRRWGTRPCVPFTGTARTPARADARSG